MSDHRRLFVSFFLLFKEQWTEDFGNADYMRSCEGDGPHGRSSTVDLLISDWLEGSRRSQSWLLLWMMARNWLILMESNDFKQRLVLNICLRIQVQCNFYSLESHNYFLPLKLPLPFHSIHSSLYLFFSPFFPLPFPFLASLTQGFGKDSSSNLRQPRIRVATASNVSCKVSLRHADVCLLYDHFVVRVCVCVISTWLIHGPSMTSVWPGLDSCMTSVWLMHEKRITRTMNCAWPTHD